MRRKKDRISPRECQKRAAAKKMTQLVSVTKIARPTINWAVIIKPDIEY